MGKNKSYTWYLNGEFVPAEKAVLPISDLGLQRGWGVFDFLRTYNGKPFQLIAHLARFRHSADKSLITVNNTAKEMESIINKLLSRNNVKGSVGIKLFATAGRSRDGLSPTGETTFGVMILPLHGYPRKMYQRGIKLDLYRELRVNPQVKSTNYAAVLIYLMRVRRRGFDDILYVGDDDLVYESARSNFFAFVNNTLVTPKEGVLLGITRKLVIALARKRFPVKEGTLTLKQLERAQEAFITSTEREIMPVVQIGETQIGDGKVGLRTKQLMKAFKEAASMVAIIK